MVSNIHCASKLYILDYLTGVFTPLQRDLFHNINSYQVRKLNKFVMSQTDVFTTDGTIFLNIIKGKLVLYDCLVLYALIY